MDELIAETKRGLLISRFWYIRTVDQKKAIVTGMTRDGTFLIENGKVGGGVRNMRFNQSIIAALGKCEFSNAPQRTGDYWFSLVVPAAKIEGLYVLERNAVLTAPPKRISPPTTSAGRYGAEATVTAG